MLDYRAYILGIDGHRFLKVAEFASDYADDAAAIRAAEQLVHDHDVELWQSARLVTRIDHKLHSVTPRDERTKPEPPAVSDDSPPPIAESEGEPAANDVSGPLPTQVSAQPYRRLRQGLTQLASELLTALLILLSVCFFLVRVFDAY